MITAPDAAAAVRATLLELQVTLLQTNNSTYTSPYDDPWKNHDAWQGFVQPFMDLMGPVAPAMLGIGVAGVLYIVGEGRVALPATISVLIGGFLLPFLPPAAKIGAILSIVFGVAIGLYGLWNGGGARPR